MDAFWLCPDNSHGWVWLRELRVAAVIGILDHERLAPQPLVVTVGLWAPTAAAREGGTLGPVPDYRELAATVTETVGSRHWAWVEALAEALAAALLHRFAAQRAAVEVVKPDAVPAGRAAVSLVRTRP